MEIQNVLAKTVFHISGDLGEWRLLFHAEELQSGIETASWRLESDEARTLPELRLSFNLPYGDTQLKWNMLPLLEQSHHYFQWWWKCNQKIAGNIAYNAPVFCYMNLEGVNHCSFALSDAKHCSFTTTGPSGKPFIFTELLLFHTPRDPVKFAEFSIRFDWRKIPYFEVLKDLADWYVHDLGYKPLFVPDHAELPVYSSWVQFLRGVSQEKLECELPLIAEFGFKNIILDDGWQCHGTQMDGDAKDAHMGTWLMDPGKFPDFAAHVRKFHEKGLRYIVWFATALLSRSEPEVYERFRGKYLEDNATCILDPRYPEVREFIAGTCERMVRDWDIDGLKLDFIDCFHLPPNVEDDIPAKNGYAGCDFKNLAEAVNALLADTVRRLKKLKPEILIEFRQYYNGPAARRYANMLRVADCTRDMLQNRVRTVDIRLLSGDTPAHSDMIAWSNDDSVEIAALHFLNILFSVPQVSMRLETLSEEHARMLKFWLRFWTEHRRTLLHGKFEAAHPELSYPLLRAFGEKENIIASYQKDLLVRVPGNGTTYVINATHADQIPLALLSESEIRRYDVYGEKRDSLHLPAGTNVVPVFPGGFAKIVPCPIATRQIKNQ